jgi:Domain of unknown function (DUF4407)
VTSPFANPGPPSRLTRIVVHAIPALALGVLTGVAMQDAFAVWTQGDDGTLSVRSISPWLSALTGLVVSALGFAIYRMIRGSSPFHRLIRAVPALLFIVSLSLVVSIPLGMRVFDTETQRELIKSSTVQQEIQAVRAEIAQTQRVVAGYDDLQAQRDEAAAVYQGLSDKATAAERTARDEFAGIGPSKVAGAGPSYQALQMQADALNAQAVAAKAKLADLTQRCEDAQAGVARARGTLLDDQVRLETMVKKYPASPAYGLGDRLAAFQRVASSQSAVGLASCLLALLVACLGALPILLGVLSRPAPAGTAR